MIGALAVLVLLAGCQDKASDGSTASVTPSATASGPPPALASAFPPPAGGQTPPTPAARGSRGTTITLGSAGFTESEVLTSLYSALLTADGYTIKLTREPATDTLEWDLEHKAVDVVPHYAADYTEQLNLLVRGAKAPPVASSDLSATLAQLGSLAASRNVRPLKAAAAVDGPAFAVTAKFAKSNNVTTLSDLGRLGVPIRLAAAADCATDPQCQPGLLSTYGIKIDPLDPVGLGTSAAIRAVVNKHDEMAQVLTTDTTLNDNKLVILRDDKQLQLANNVLPVVSLHALTKAADLGTLLDRLSPVLTTADLAFMDRLVDAGHDPPDDVARAYLKSKGLL